MSTETETHQEKSIAHQSLFKNPTLLLLWSGKSLSIIGDAFFDLAVMWVIYAQSGSTFQSALIGVASQLTYVLMSPVAGVFADRWDRKTIMWSSNFLSAIVVGSVAAIFFTLGYLPLIVALASILVLNSLSVFIDPAESSVMPEIIGKERLSAAYGVFSVITQAANLIGKGVAGVTIALIGSGWALTGDSLSFIIVAVCILLAKIPRRKLNSASADRKVSILSDIKEGWAYMNQHSILKALIWLAFLVNISSFIGPLYPALVDTQLHRGAGAFGLLQASVIIGSIIGGLSTGFFDRRFKTGQFMGISLLIAGLATLGIGSSHMLILTMFFQIIQTFFTAIASIMIMSTELILVSDEYRGRITGLMQSMAMMAMPISTIIAGGIGDLIHVTYLFYFSAIWVLAISLFILITPNMRGIDTKKSDNLSK